MRVFDPQQQGLTRVERAERARRRRARKHLDRIQGRTGAAPRRRSAAAPRGGRERVRPQVPRRGVALLVMAASLGAGALAETAWRRDATLDSLAVQGLRRVGAAEIGERSGLAPGTPLSELDADALSQRLVEHGWIEAARVLPLPTGRVLVAVDEREPAALLVGETPWAVDEAGVAFAPLDDAETAGLTRIAWAETPAGGAAHPELAEAVALARRLPGLGLPAPEEIGVAAPGDPQGYTLRLPGLAPRVVLGRDDLDTKLTDLARLLDTALPVIGRAQQVDLRFRDQAVLDVPPPQGAEPAAAAHGAATPSNTSPAG